MHARYPSATISAGRLCTGPTSRNEHKKVAHNSICPIPTSKLINALKRFFVCDCAEDAKEKNTSFPFQIKLYNIKCMFSSFYAHDGCLQALGIMRAFRRLPPYVAMLESVVHLLLVFLVQEKKALHLFILVCYAAAYESRHTSIFRIRKKHPYSVVGERRLLSAISRVECCSRLWDIFASLLKIQIYSLCQSWKWKI